jgi:hypothetical protein
MAKVRRLPRALAFCALMLVTPSTARAEVGSAQVPSRDDSGFAVYAFAGYSGWDTSALNARLVSLGYRQYAQDPGSGGLGMRGWGHGWMGAMEFQFAMGEADGDAGRRLSLTSGRFMLHAGRILYSGKHLNMYVIGGLGLGGSLLSLDSGATPGARMQLGFPGGLSNAGTQAFDLQALVGVDYLVDLGESRRFNGFLIGLRAGYDAEPAVSSWSSSASGGAATETPVNLPRVTADGPFVHLVFGDARLGI